MRRVLQIGLFCLSFLLAVICLFIKACDAAEQRRIEEVISETEVVTETESETETETCTTSETESETETETEKPKPIVTLNTFSSFHNHPDTEYVSPADFKLRGRVYFNGWSFSYYSERVLPGKRLNIPGRWSDTYFVKDREGNICVASSELKWGTYIMTPWGQGRVYDSGCAKGTIDIYVTW